MKKQISLIITFAVLLTGFVSNPVVATTNLVVNGDFETPAVTASQKWDIYNSGTPGLGWTVEWYDGSTSYGGWTRPEPAHLELHRGVNSWLPYGGSQYTELDTDWNGHSGSLNNEPASVKIYQDIPVCEFGGYYTLSYAWSPRPGHTDNEIKVYWNAMLIDTHSGSGGSNISWTLETHSGLVGMGSTAELAFIETGNPDSLGMFLDEVSVIQDGPCAPGAIDISKSVDKTEIYPGETVIYTYTVTNVGDFDLFSVMIDDDKCSPVTGPSGDDGDGILNPAEVWTYACSVALSDSTVNTATVTVYDPFENEITDQASAEVAIKDLGCTLTQGYWKTHSTYGPAPYDPIWGGHEDDKLQGLEWYDILWTPPKKGNAWYILAHQYIAAKLNEMNAFVPADVDTALTNAESLLGGYTPSQVEAKAFDKALRNDFLETAYILDQYNNGEMGVPHCSDYVLVDTVEVPANSSVGVCSNISLENGVGYQLKATGVAYAGDTIDFDAEYSITNRIAGDTWTDSVSGYESHGPTLLDLMVDDSFVDWGAYAADHTYYHSMTGSGASVCLRIYDIYYPNNTGNLTVYIYRVE